MTNFDQLVRIAQRGLPFTSTDGRPFFRISIPSSGGFQIVLLRSLAFRNWFFANYFGDYNSLPTNAGFRAILHHLEAQANFSPGNQRLAVRQRVGSRGRDPLPSQILLDLADEEGQFVEISPDGWVVTAGENALLETRRATLELPVPTHHPDGPAAALDTLRSCLNLSSRTGWLRCLAWLLSAFRPFGPCSFLVIQGPPGSGKTFTARLLRYLVDPATAPLSPLPHSARQLLAMARHHWLLTFDHVSTLTPPFNDAFCRLATGAGALAPEVAPADPARDTLFQFVRRPAVFAVTSQWSPAPDFARRALTITLADLPPDRLRSETEIFDQFTPAYPAVLGALCSALSTALRRRPEIQLTGDLRHPDTLAWALAAAPALGYTESEMQEALTGTAAPPPLFQFLDSLLAETGHWSGTATALFRLLPPDPKFGNPRALKQALNAAAAPLAAAGIAIESGAKHNPKLIHLRRVANPGNLPGFASPNPAPTPQSAENKTSKSA